MKKKVVDPRFAKGARYKKIINEIKEVGVCPFCPENFRWHTKPILKRAGDWFITKNFNPYKNTRYHFLAIKKTHKERLEELSARDWKELSILLSWTIKKFKLKGGGLAMRFGDTALTGATVCHIHAHLIVPKLQRGKAVPVWFPFG
jgi:diadenosine tetraphosphate (Ap4A) HIT family hydrolase